MINTAVKQVDRSTCEFTIFSWETFTCLFIIGCKFSIDLKGERWCIYINNILPSEALVPSYLLEKQTDM